MTKHKHQEPVSPAHPPLMCANGGCPYEARVKVRRRRLERGPNGKLRHRPYGAWLNLCHSCDDARVRGENTEYCREMGLDTPAKQRAWCLEQLKHGIVKREFARAREPGDDDEEVSA